MLSRSGEFMFRKKIFYVLSSFVLIFTLSNVDLAQNQEKSVYGIFLDNSESLTEQFPNVLGLSKQVTKRIAKNGSISLFNFKTEDSQKAFPVGMEARQDELLINKHIENLSIAKGQASLLDAIQLMTEKLEATVGSDKKPFADKTIILITDGEDTTKSTKGPFINLPDNVDERRGAQNKLIKMVKAKGIKVYAIGLTRNLDNDQPLKPTAREQAESFLNKIAKQTGGRSVIVRSKLIDINKILDELFAS